MNYEAMSDDEINYEVAKHSFDAEWLERHYGKEGMIPDYCNDVEDAWQVIFENKISMCTHLLGDGSWSAKHDVVVLCQENGTIMVHSFTSNHKNPLRAAMIVYLMLKDAKND